jgi:YegS/Rv2252/BmrU family lipid kinase
MNTGGPAHRFCIVFNPCAKGEKAKAFREGLDSFAPGVPLKPTFAAGAATILAREAVEEGFQVIVAAGGDGTVNEVLNGIAEARDGLERACLAVLPLGTMNVFSRELGQSLDVRKVWDRLRTVGVERRVDLPVAEYQTPDGPVRRHYAQMAGAGVDARAVRAVDWEEKKRLRAIAYFNAGLRTLRTKRPPVRVQADERSWDVEQVLIGNGRYYGGSVPVFWRAALDDGIFDLVLLRKTGWLNLAHYGWQMLWRTKRPSGGLDYAQASEVTLTGEPDEPLELDGELVGTLPAKLTLQPNALRVLVGK